MNYKAFKLLIFILLTTFSFSLISCKDKVEKEPEISQTEQSASNDSLFFKLSLAQWSLHKAIQQKELDPLDFARKANEMGFEGLEYVTGFYAARINSAEDPKAEMQLVLDSLKAKSEKYGMKNLLLMVDGEGDLAINDAAKRDQAVENHKKWVDAAEFLGCHSIRVNLFGSDKEDEWKSNSVDALKKLAGYANEKGINILVENHGYLSSNADLLVEVMKEVNMENCGTLPDFGNFCLKREGGERWNAQCVEEFPRYEGVEKMMPYAKAVSAKSYTFDEKGNEDLIDYTQMLKIIKDAGYSGFIGVEFEGEELSEEKGIMATKELLITAGREL